MFDRLVSFLRAIPGAPPGSEAFSRDDPRVAAAALLYHVMDADGVRRREEVARLRDVISDAYDLSGSELESVLEAGEEADHDAVDLYAFTSVLKRHLDQEARVDFIKLMWEIVYADRTLHELEDNMVWRVAELIGVERRDRVDMRRAVAARAVGDGSEGTGDD